ncbi:MAG: isoprenylcysteine carboxylmethyltransferase family protein [Vicinamibacterales bacterium]
MGSNRSVLKDGLRLLGLAAFVASLALLGWWWIRVASRPITGASAGAAAADTVLFSVFALHHSLLARERLQRPLRLLVPPDLLRTTYVVVASLLLASTCLLWRPVGGLVYHARGIGAASLYGVQLLGLGLTFLATRRISLRELAGLDDPARHVTAPLQHGGVYRIVRHPIYLGWVLMVGAAPVMTGDRLLFAAVSTVYLALAIPFEEAGLLRTYGNAYRTYQRAVPSRLVPYIY